ncbi:MAG: hypothetical protein ACM3KR_05875 [Deltaproteobacteria bacterium]
MGKRAKKLTAYLLTAVMLVSAIPTNSFADITFTEDVVLEQDLPFTINDANAKTYTEIPIPADYRNVEVLSGTVDNGRITGTSVESDKVTVNLDGGTRSSEPVTKAVTQAQTVQITNQTPGSSNVISLQVPQKVTAISAVDSSDGSLLSAEGTGTTTIAVKVDPNKGTEGYDYITPDTEAKRVTIDAGIKNKSSMLNLAKTVTEPVKSIASVIPYIEGVSTAYGSCSSASTEKELKACSIRVNFTQGAPVNLVTKVTPYTMPKRWADRHLDLAIDTPNLTNTGRISVKVNPLDLAGFPASSFNEERDYDKPVDSENGSDFWGYYIGDPVPVVKDTALNENAGNIFLSTKYPTKKVLASDIKNYGTKPYSTDYAVFTIKSTGVHALRHFVFKKPQESFPAYKGNESQDTFYDPLYKDVVTKVYHWYFWTGPEEWGGFTGINTYPYKATVVYTPYKKVRFYTGSVTYQYEDTVTIPGGTYNYSGKVRIKYTVTKTIIDKPPTTPGGVIAAEGKIMHGPSVDDYTPEAQLRYIYYYNKNNTWYYLGENTGTREYTWIPSSFGLDPLNLKVGVVTVDSRNQTSGRAENDPNAYIKLTGSLSKTVVQPGEKIDIYAQTESSPDCYEVGYNIEDKYGKGTMNKNGKVPYEVNINTISGKWRDYYQSGVKYEDKHFTHVGRYNPQGTYEEFYSTENILYRINYKLPQMIKELKSVVDIAANGAHAAALKLDGSVWTWGNNDLNIGKLKYYAQLSNFQKILKASAGSNFCLALKDDGTVWSWGYNGSGQLGVGGCDVSATPIKVNELTNIVDICTGSNFCLALKNDGTVWSWGDNVYGQLGDGTTVNKSLPSKIASLSGITAISAGNRHSLVLKNDGTVWAWGENTYCQLGDNTWSNRTAPIQVPNIADITAISASAGGLHNLVLKKDGTVWSWGYNGSGQLGNGAGKYLSYAVRIPSLSGVGAISAGSSHSLALKKDGTLWAWGDNSSGELGNNSTNSSSTPIQINGINNINKISAGCLFTLALKNDGTVWAWGDNTYGQLGDNSTINKLLPVQIALPNSVTAIYAGIYNGMVLKNDETLWTCGDNRFKQLGFVGGEIQSSSTPVKASSLTNIKNIAAGANHYLFLKNDKTVWSYGINSSGQLGNGSTDANMSPALVNGLNNVKAVAAGSAHSLALKEDGTIWAWGDNSKGQLGDNSWVNRTTPVRVSNITNVIAISAGSMHSLAVTSDGAVWAWGKNTTSQLGDGSTSESGIPVKTKGISSAVGVAGGDAHSFGLVSNGTLKAWGRNKSGQLGCDDTDDVSSAVDALISDVKAVDAGDLHSIALKNDGTVWAWGDNTHYQATSSSPDTDVLRPVQITQLSSMVKVDAGNSFNLALKNDGTVWSWGNEASGELGFSKSYVFGKQGTVIIPDLNRYGFKNQDYLNVVSKVGQASAYYPASDGEYITNVLKGSTQSINPINSEANNSFGTLSFFQYAQSYGGAAAASSYQKAPSWASSGVYITGVYTYVQIWNQRVFVPYWNLPVTVTFNDKVYRVYQNGSFIAEVTADRSMEGIYFGIPEMRSKTGSEAASNAHTYTQLGSSTGKTVLTDKAWSIDNINTFIAGAYGDTYHIADLTKFRQQGSLTEDSNGWGTLDYGGVRSNGGTHPANLPDLLPGTLKWRASVTLPGNITGGYHYVTLTAKNGLEKSIRLAFFVDIPEELKPKGIIPYYVSQGKSYIVSAKTTKQADTVNLIIFGNTYSMAYNGIDNSDPDYPEGAKCWSCSISIPINADCGLYNNASGLHRLAEFKASSSSGRTESDYKPFNVRLSLNPIGNVPDLIETKTNWKAKCTTNISVASVTVKIEPSPGGSPYNMVLVDNDGLKKYWESADLQYPEGSAGACGVLVTGIFTARGPADSIETDKDTGMLYEKLEVIGYELRHFYYKNGDQSQPVVEALCRSSGTKSAGSAGFIMAGWDMGIKVLTKGYVDRVEFDFDGPTIKGQKDLSIKTIDKLTKRFEWDEPVYRKKTPFSFSSVKELEEHYSFPRNFNKRAKPESSFENIFTDYYLIPYGTKQTLHSWYTLREESGDAFKIDKSRLLERIKNPFILKLSLYSGARSIEKSIEFDAFERWDTLLNRDIKPYIENPEDYDPVDKNYWETTMYVEKEK